MIVLDEQVVVDRGPAEVFDHLIDLSRYPQWHPAIESARWTTDRQASAGAPLRLVVRVPPRRVDVDGEIVRAQRPELLEVRSTSGPIRGHITCELVSERRGRRTRLAFHVELQPTGLLRFVERVMADRLRAEMPATLAQLRARLEAGIPVGPPSPSGKR